jgi:lipopolysaccharide biosynthesis regulator YciM
MEVIWYFLAVATVFGLGFHAGRDAEKREAKKQADAIRRALIAGLTSGMERAIRDRAGQRVAKAEAKPTQAKPTADVKATEPLRFKPGDADRALRDGNLALLKDYDGQDN